MNSQSISLNPIGVVESAFRCVTDRFDYERSESALCLRPDLEAALSGIEYFSHLWVIYHQHRSREWLEWKGWGSEGPAVVPPGDERAGQGVFCGRFPCRPSGIGSCIVRLLRREGACLIVSGLDALDGTPVLDVKVYVPQFDAFPNATAPLHWAGVTNRPDDFACGARTFHWDTTNTEFALGLRAGTAALGRVGAERGGVLRSTLRAGFFFAQGWEAATGCSALRGTLAWETGPGDVWYAELEDPGRPDARVALHISSVGWRDAADVLGAPESRLFLSDTGAKP
jgi:tRNA-Thr(GGU) m(6)t(6)A37 methyltransferase TsaA